MILFSFQANPTAPSASPDQMNDDVQGMDVQSMQADRGENGECAEVFEKNHDILYEDDPQSQALSKACESSLPNSNNFLGFNLPLVVALLQLAGKAGGTFVQFLSLFRIVVGIGLASSVLQDAWSSSSCMISFSSFEPGLRVCLVGLSFPFQGAAGAFPW